MHVLFEFAYRIAAIALCLSYGNQVWVGLVERKIASFNTDLPDRWGPGQIFQRDTAPVRYWMQIGINTITSVVGFVAAIVGWWQPNT